MAKACFSASARTWTRFTDYGRQAWKIPVTDPPNDNNT